MLLLPASASYTACSDYHFCSISFDMSYVAVIGNPSVGECHVVGLNEEELSRLRRRFGHEVSRANSATERTSKQVPAHDDPF